MKIVCFGTGAFGIPSFEALTARHEIIQIVTAPDKPRGRALRVFSSPVKVWAQSRGLTCFQPADIRAETAAQSLKAFGADVFLVIAYGYLLPKSILSIPRVMALNLHASLLPRYRGAAPVHWAILNGERETGVSVIRMVEPLDAGEILIQKKTPIAPEDDIFSLRERLSRIGAHAVTEALEILEKGRANFFSQDESLVTQARKLTKEDGRLRWSDSAEKISNQVRALKDWPGSYAFYKKKRFLILSAVPDSAVKKNKDWKPGRVLRASAAAGLLLAAGDGALRIEKLQLEGRQPLEARDFLNGFPIEEGGFFE
jgi:methionyl-tRNA formyltransferase